MKMTIAGVPMTGESKRRLSPYKVAAAVVLSLLLIYPFWASDY
jgi:hypothetical protein